eukprot:TRINITY_DN5414_c0_g1_i1.p1 TRINITY_DN5414_c0_g1~~TRINITY_DN5414_c0_g1_i1.p1  ORF type:complete len:542 (+),score=123.06 TRINITY_DN5414_c0_g1_i1:143-1768(+)
MGPPVTQDEAQKPNGAQATKFSFSISSSRHSSAKSKLKRQQEEENEGEEDQLEYLSEFDPSKPSRAKAPKVIPKQENTWRREPKMKNIQLDVSENGLQFETDADVKSEAPEEKVSYGLNVRNSAASEANGEEEKLRVLRQEIENLSEEASLEKYDSLPVEDFGAALLRGMGWNESEGVGKKRKVVDPVQFVRRVGREGLGAVPAPKVETQKRISKPGDKTEGKRDLVAAPGEDGKVRNVIGIGEKLVERVKKGASVGKVVRIVGGRHSGLKCEILDLIHGESRIEKVLAKLIKSEEKAVIDVRDIADLGSVEEEEFWKRMKSRKDSREREFRDRKLDSERKSKKVEGRSRRLEGKCGRSPESDRNKKMERESLADENHKDRRNKHHDRSSDSKDRRKGNDGSYRTRDHHESSRAAVPVASSWLRSHIRVRVISKEFKKGKLYLKKGRIVDVVDPTTCDLLMDESGVVVQGVKQDMLETALPKRGGLVLVVMGKHKGVLGKLLDRDLNEGIGVVQKEDTYDMLRLSLDDIAEFLGDPSELGY